MLPPKIEAIYRYKQHFKISNLTCTLDFFRSLISNNIHSKNYYIEFWLNYANDTTNNPLNVYKKKVFSFHWLHYRFLINFNYLNIIYQSIYIYIRMNHFVIQIWFDYYDLITDTIINMNYNMNHFSNYRLLCNLVKLTIQWVISKIWLIILQTKLKIFNKL